MAIKQEDLLGMLIPSADITKVTLETSRPSGLSVTVDLSIYDVIEKDEISRWFAQEDFSRFIKVALFQSTAPQARRIISTAIDNFQLSSRQVETLTSSGISIKTFSMKDILPRERDFFQNTVRTIESDGTSFHEFRVSETFKFKQEPSNLVYAAFAYIDIQSMEEFFNVELMSRLQQQKSLAQNGKVSVEEVILNDKTVSTSIVYITKDGQVWNGPRHPRNGQWYQGTREAGEELIEKGSYPEVLTFMEVANSKVQDFRILERAKMLQIDETLIHNSLSEIEVADQPSVETLKQTFYSDIWLTRGLSGEARFMFAIDMATMIRKLGHYGKILDKLPLDSQRRLLSYSKIRTIKLLRKRVVNVNTLNSIGTPYGGKADFDRNQEIEVIAFTGQVDNSLIDVSTDTGSLRESEISLETEKLGVRFFTGTDKSIKSITDGLYQYGVEIDFIDGTRQFLQDTIDELIISRSKLSAVLFRVEAPRNKKDYFYDPNLNRFTENFKFTAIETRDISSALSLYARLASTFGDIDFNQFNALSSISRTPSFIRFMLEAFDLLISKLSVAIELSGDHLSDSRIGSGLKFIITDKKFFANATFDSNVDKGSGLDFLMNQRVSRLVDDEIIEISSEQEMTIGLKIVDAGEWEERLDLELEKFYTSKTPSTTFPKRNSKSIEPTESSDMSGEPSAYMTPIIIRKNRLIIPNVLDDEETQKKKEDKLVKFKDNSGNDTGSDFFSSFGVSFFKAGRNILKVDSKIADVIPRCSSIGEGRATAIDPSGGWTEEGNLIVPISNEPIQEETTSTSACNEGQTIGGDNEEAGMPSGYRTYDLMRETIMNIGLAKPPKKVVDEKELIRIYSSTDSLSIPMRENIDTAPLQIQSLFPEFKDQSLSTGSTLTGPKFRLNYSFIAKIEYLKDFGDNQVEFQNRKERKNYKQIKEPIWESLDKRTFLTVAGEELLCRLKMVVVEELGIKVAEPFKHLPVYDSYFILKPPVTRINAQLLQGPEEIETQGLLEPVSQADSIGLYSLRRLRGDLLQEELDLIDERSDLINRRLEITSNPDNYVEENSLRNIRGEKPLRPTAQIQVDLINGRIEEIRIRRQEIARELADPKFDVLSYYDNTI